MSKIMIDALNKYVKEKQIQKIRKIADLFHPRDLYLHIENWNIDDILALLRFLTIEQASNLFEELTPNQQEEIIQFLSSKEISDLFNEFYIDETIDILKELPKNIVSKILSSVNKTNRKKINNVLKYEKGTIGFNMNVDFVSIKYSQTIKQAKEELKREIEDKSNEILGIIFVHDSNNKFIGYIKPDLLFTAKNTQKVSTFTIKMNSVKSSDYIETAKEILLEYDIPSVPVVNSKGIQTGVIESDDIIEKYDSLDEAYFDRSAVVATTKPYIETTAFELFKSRAFWIIMLIFLGAVTQVIITGFQAIWASTGFWTPESELANITLTTVITLAFSTAISVSSSINDAAGNTGNQSSSTLVRALALGEVNNNQYGKAIIKETVTGVYIGGVAALVATIRTFLVWAMFGYLTDIDGLIWGWLSIIALIAAFSFFISIIIGNFLGAIIPILADKFKYDGAIISGPVQTTLVDIITFAVYLGITTAVFVPLALAGYFGPEPKDPSLFVEIFSDSMNTLIINLS